jgi:hypothetical protein
MKVATHALSRNAFDPELTIGSAEMTRSKAPVKAMTAVAVTMKV